MTRSTIIASPQILVGISIMIFSTLSFHAANLVPSSGSQPASLSPSTQPSSLGDVQYQTLLSQIQSLNSTLEAKLSNLHSSACPNQRAVMTDNDVLVGIFMMWLMVWMTGGAVLLNGCWHIDRELPMKVSSVATLAANVALVGAAALIRPDTWCGYVLFVVWVVDVAIGARLMLVKATAVGGRAAGAGSVPKEKERETEKEGYEVVSK